MEDTLLTVGLSKDKTIELFNKAFGVDQITRTRKQWKNLVDKYGYPVVMEKEKMSKAQIKAKCKNG